MKTAIFTLLLLILAVLAGCAPQDSTIDNITDNITNETENITDEVINVTQNITQNITDTLNETYENDTVPVAGNNDFLEVVGSSQGLNVSSMDVNYYDNVSGYLVKPDDNESYPGIVMIHEWWGLNDNIRNAADVLASNGYVVLAVDLYNGTVTTDSQEAMQLSSQINSSLALENMRGAVEYLNNEENITSIASFGWCLGGDMSVQLSQSDVDLDATVIYYGELPTDMENISRMDGPVLGIFGSDDEIVPVESVNDFENALNESGIENEIYIYDGVGHAFANPSSDTFERNDTKDAWNKTLIFLDTNLN